jgi:hypothetical protein
MTEEEREESPLRYALCEVVNLYDHGISIHPIHRVLFNVEPSAALRQLVSILNSMGADARMMYTRGSRSIAREGMQIIQFESKMAKGRIEICHPVDELVSMTLTTALDALVEQLPRAELDYIHGDEEFHELAKEHANIGFLMEPMLKEQLFSSVIEYGVLPKKAFSLGLAVEKRYYYESRLLVNLKPAAEPEAQPEETEAVPEAPETEAGQTEAFETPAQEYVPQEEYDAQDALLDEEAYADDGEEASEPRKKRRGLFGRRKDR